MKYIPCICDGGGGMVKERAGDGYAHNFFFFFKPAWRNQNGCQITDIQSEKQTYDTH